MDLCSLPGFHFRETVIFCILPQTIVLIYTEPPPPPKKKKRYKVVYCIILWNAITWPFCILYKLCAMFWGHMLNLNPVQWSEIFVGRFERFARPARYLYFRVLWRWKKNSTIDREYSKTTKNQQKLITKRIRKEPYLAQYTKIGKVIKRFRTAVFDYLDKWQFVLKLYGHLSFIIMNLCTKTEETQTKMCEDFLSENKGTQEVAERLTFDLLIQSKTCSSLSSCIVGIWSNNIHSYCTRSNGLFMSHYDLDLQTGELKLYVCFLSWCSTN